MDPDWLRYLAWFGLLGSVIALILLAVAPVGWRFGLWHFRTSFYQFMSTSGFIALAAAIASAIALILGAGVLDGRTLTFAIMGLLLGLGLAYVPWHWKRTLKKVPRIHDITTDTANPPPFSAVLAARKAETAASADYEGAEIARQQQAAYPDLAPLKTALPATEAYKHALAVAETMPRWSIVARDTAAGRIEASEASRWFRFIDDMVIRIAPEGQGSRIDMRSLSRQGRSDFGVNAARIRAYMAALKRRLD